MFATCSTCGQEMNGTTCITTRAYPWGQEPDFQRPPLSELGPIWKPCRDCLTPPGGNHHEGCFRAHCRLGCGSPDEPDVQAQFCEHAPDDDDDGGGEELPVPPPLDFTHDARQPFH